MKYWLLVVGAMVGTRPALGQVSISPGHYGKLSPEAQVRWSNEETYRACERRDSARLVELLHNDYFRMGSDGTSRKRATVTRWSSGSPPDGSRDAPARVRVRLPNASTAVLMQDDVHITAAGDTVRATHETDVWVKEQGRWQLYASTSTREQLGPEVRAIRAGSARRNRAYAAHDTTLLGPLLAPGFQLLAGGGSRPGRAANQRGLSELFRQRPDLRLVFTPEQITASAALRTGSETGTWIELWTAPDGPVELRGTYYAAWEQEQGQWLQKAIIMLPISCFGGSYCRP